MHLEQLRRGVGGEGGRRRPGLVGLCPRLHGAVQVGGAVAQGDRETEGGREGGREEGGGGVAPGDIVREGKREEVGGGRCGDWLHARA